MAFVPAICTQCGAQIEVDDSHEAGICKHCGTAFITEKAIFNYNMSVNSVNVDNAVFNINNESADILFKRFETLEKLDDVRAVDASEELIRKCPDDYRSWISKMILRTDDVKKVSEKIKKGVIDIGLKGFIVNSLIKNHEEVIDFFNKANIVASNDFEKDAIDRYKKEYDKIYEEYQRIVQKGTDNARICNNFKRKTLEKALGCELPEKIVYGAWDDQYIFHEIIFAFGHTVILTVKMGERYLYKGTMCKVNIDSVDTLLSNNKTKDGLNKGCYIATCVYGSYDCPEVWTLRRFRDFTLDETWYGRLFIKCYYAISPVIVKKFGETKWFRTFWKTTLDKMVHRLNKKGVENTKYSDKY